MLGLQRGEEWELGLGTGSIVTSGDAEQDKNKCPFYCRTGADLKNGSKSKDKGMVGDDSALLRGCARLARGAFNNYVCGSSISSNQSAISSTWGGIERMQSEQ